jgi:tetratricopeptide (TPR) repeat protein
MNASLSKIIDLINNKNYAKAETALYPLLKENPHSFDINKMMGAALLAQREYNKALPIFEKCYSIKDNDFDVLLNISFLFLKVQHLDQTILFANKALQSQPDTPGPYQNIANAYYLMQKFDLARENIEKCIEIRGGINSKYFYELSELRNLYAEILLAQGDKINFSKFIKGIIKKRFDSALLLKLLRNNHEDIEKEHLSQIDDMMTQVKSNQNLMYRNNHLASGHFFLAEYLTRIDQKKSEDHYILANKLISDIQRVSLFDRQKFYFNIINFFNNFDEKDVLRNIDPNKGDGLIFIIGMPRSGTTLTESILSTASNIVAGGEKTFFPLQLTDIVKKIKKENKELSWNFFEDLGNRYLNFIKTQRDGNKHFIDKLPENHLFYKYIKLALPKAKFIHCFRDPWDNAISLFKQNYSINVHYASSFFGIANEIANYSFLMNFWKKKDGDSAFLDVKYEEIIENKSLMIDIIWKYCKLEGEYSEEKRKLHFGRTASMQQVTKDIYKSSLKKNDFKDFQSQFMQDLKNQQQYINKTFN